VENNGVWYTSIYHPSALLRDLGRRPETFLDLLSIRDKIREVCPTFYPQSDPQEK
jgi:DNA polymerase